MLDYEVSKASYEEFKKDLMNNEKAFSWFKDELFFQEGFKVNANRETVLQQIITVNSKYFTYLSFGKSSTPDEGGEFADFFVSESFQSRINTIDKDIATALVMDLAKAAKTRGHFNLSFASKYCHFCNPNMFPIYDSINVRFLKDHYLYEDHRNYREYIEYMSSSARTLVLI